MLHEYLNRDDYYGLLLEGARHTKEHSWYFINLFDNTDGMDSMANIIAKSTLALYEEYLSQRFDQQVLTDHVRFCLRFSCMACIDAMAHWLKSGMRQSPEDLVQWMADCLPSDLRPLLMGGGEGVVDGCVS